MADNATRADIARLFGRAAFGATSAILTQWEGRPYVEAVDSLFPPGPPGTIGRLPHLDEAERLEVSNINNVEYAGRWWLERMRTTPYPLEERMTLFWHDHFATAAIGEPSSDLVMQQNETLRTHALGNFRALANAMTTDPAMLMWLNGIANHVNGVNENYAREFFELFTLGVIPQGYTETDIREAAKVFTGWTVFNFGVRLAQFTEARHTMGTKTVLGRTIGGYPPADPRLATEYQEVTEAALAYDGGRTASRFLAYKLVQQFGYPPNEADITLDPVIEDVAAAIRAGDAWDIKAGVRTMLLHDGWRNAPLATGSDLIRSPIEVVVHGAKVLGLPLDFHGGSTQPQNMYLQMDRTAQVPLLPPNVSGWPSGRNWLAQTTMLARYNLVHWLAQSFRNELRNFVPMTWPASGDLAGWTAYLGLAGLSTSTTLRIQELLADPSPISEQDKQHGVFILVGTSPDWQVM